MRKLCFILLLIFNANNSVARDECLSGRPLTSELVREIHEIVAATLIAAGLSLDSGNCVQAAALNSALMQMLGFQEGRDFSLISTNLHVHTYIPSTSQILDPTIAQFFLRNSERVNQMVSQKGFLGTRSQLQDLFKKNFGFNAEGIARTGWRITPSSSEYINFSPPQDAALFSAQQIAGDILRNRPETSTGQALRSALARTLNHCDRNLLSSAVTCTRNDSILNTDSLEEVIFSQNYLRNMIP
jgi:hypothetical protein